MACVRVWARVCVWVRQREDESDGRSDGARRPGGPGWPGREMMHNCRLTFMQQRQVRTRRCCCGRVPPPRARRALVCVDQPSTPSLDPFHHRPPPSLPAFLPAGPLCARPRHAHPPLALGRPELLLKVAPAAAAILAAQALDGPPPDALVLPPARCLSGGGGGQLVLAPVHASQALGLCTRVRRLARRRPRPARGRPPAGLLCRRRPAPVGLVICRLSSSSISIGGHLVDRRPAPAGAVGRARVPALDPRRRPVDPSVPSRPRRVVQPAPRPAASVDDDDDARPDAARRLGRPVRRGRGQRRRRQQARPEEARAARR